MSELQLQTHDAVQSTKKMRDRFSDLLKVSLIGPDNIEGSEAKTYKEVWSHRTKYYNEKAPHLLQLSERALESDLDHRGIIFAVSSSTGVLASLRLIQRPFEIEGYEYKNINFTDYSNYWEIGRLVTTPALDHISLAIVVQYLLCISGLEMFSLRGCKGLIGICKPNNIKFFSKFGMEAGQNIYCPNRDLNYSMLKGDIKDILDSTSKIVKYENRIHNRLSCSLG